MSLSSVKKMDLTLHGQVSSVETVLIRDQAVTTAKITDLHITNAKLADSAITDIKVDSAAHISGTKIASTDLPLDLTKSLADDLSARAKKAADELISGHWSFTNPITAAPGTIGTHLVTVSQLDAVSASLNSRLHAPVADLAGVAAILAFNATTAKDGYSPMEMVLAEATGTLFRFETASVLAPDGLNVIVPTDKITSSGVFATATYTLSGIPAVGDVLNFQVNGGPFSQQTFSSGMTLAQAATNIANQFNLSETLVSATATGANIIVTAKNVGTAGNAIVITSSKTLQAGSTLAVTPISSNLAGGSNPAYGAGRWLKMFVRLENAVTLDGTQIVTGAKTMNNAANVFYGDATNLMNVQDTHTVVTPGTGFTGTDLHAVLTQINSQIGTFNAAEVEAELHGLSTGTGLTAENGAYVTDLTTNYINDALAVVSLKTADKALDNALKSVADRVLTLEGKTIYSNFIDSAVGGETLLAKPVGAPAIPDSELTEFFIDGRKARRSYGSPIVVDRQFTVAADGSKVTFAPLEALQDAELRYWA